MSCHQRRIVCTAKAAVSLLMPTLTQPAFAARSYTPYGIARPSAWLRKSYTSTSSGLPCGRHVRPAFLKSPTSSFFFVSTEITGCCSASAVFTLVLMWSNCASRSGCSLPSRVLRLPCRLNFSAFSIAPMTLRLTWCPRSASSSASRRRLVQVQRNGDIGSARASGSTSVSRSTRSSNSHFGFCGLVVGWVNDGHQGGAARASRWERRRVCKGGGGQEILPRREDQIDRDRRQLAEEIAAWPKLGPCGAPEFIADVADGVDGERQQVQADQDGGEVLLAVSEAVLEVVALGLEHVERLVLDLPSRPATGGQFDDGTGADRQIGDAAVAIRRLAPGVDDLDREPVDPERVLAVAQRHVM